MARPIITLTTDFGLGRYVAQMKGAILAVCPEAQIVDVAHDVPPQDLIAAAFLLRDVAHAFPVGTVHVVVVDPGVGTARRALAVEAGARAPGQRFVGPDNGVLAGFAEGGSAHLIAERSLMRASVSHTFHGRDVFAPVAAHLAAGTPIASVGPLVGDPVRLPLPEARVTEDQVQGEVLFADTFGNLVTNIEVSQLPKGELASLAVEIGWARIEGVHRTYADAERQAMVAVIGSSGRLEVAVREGSALQRLGLKQPRGTPIKVRAAVPSALM